MRVCAVHVCVNVEVASRPALTLYVSPLSYRLPPNPAPSLRPATPVPTPAFLLRPSVALLDAQNTHTHTYIHLSPTSLLSHQPPSLHSCNSVIASLIVSRYCSAFCTANPAMPAASSATRESQASQTTPVQLRLSLRKFVALSFKS